MTRREALRFPGGIGDTERYADMAMTLRLSDEQTAKLRATADREGLWMQAAALRAIDEYVGRRAQRGDEIIEQIFTEDAQLSRRLSDA